MDSHGKLTAEMARRLEAWVPQGFEVLYDHGDSTLENVGNIDCWFGTDPNPHLDTRLSQLDIAVVKRGESRTVACALIEIEESDDRPKNILGDLFGTLMADQVGFGKEETKENIHLEARTALVMMARGPASHERRMQKMVDAVKAWRGLQLGRNSAIGHITGELFQQNEQLEEMLKKRVSEAIGRF